MYYFSVRSNMTPRSSDTWTHLMNTNLETSWASSILCLESGSQNSTLEKSESIFSRSPLASWEDIATCRQRPLPGPCQLAWLPFIDERRSTCTGIELQSHQLIKQLWSIIQLLAPGPCTWWKQIPKLPIQKGSCSKAWVSQ